MRGGSCRQLHRHGAGVSCACTPRTELEWFAEARLRAIDPDTPMASTVRAHVTHVCAQHRVRRPEGSEPARQPAHNACAITSSSKLGSNQEVVALEAGLVGISLVREGPYLSSRRIARLVVAAVLKLYGAPSLKADIVIYGPVLCGSLATAV